MATVAISDPSFSYVSLSPSPGSLMQPTLVLLVLKWLTLKFLSISKDGRDWIKTIFSTVRIKC